MRAGMFSALPYVTSRIAAELPLLIVLPLIFVSIAISMVGFQLEGARLLYHWVALVLMTINAFGYVPGTFDPGLT